MSMHVATIQEYSHIYQEYIFKLAHKKTVSHGVHTHNKLQCSIAQVNFLKYIVL